MYSIKSVAIFLRFIVSLIISRPFGKKIKKRLVSKIINLEKNTIELFLGAKPEFKY